MYKSKYFTCEEIDERLLKGYYDDAVSKGYQGTFDLMKSELASENFLDFNVIGINVANHNEALSKVVDINPNPSPGFTIRFYHTQWKMYLTLEYVSGDVNSIWSWKCVPQNIYIPLDKIDENHSLIYILSNHLRYPGPYYISSNSNNRSTIVGLLYNYESGNNGEYNCQMLFTGYGLSKDGSIDTSKPPFLAHVYTRFYNNTDDTVNGTEPGEYSNWEDISFYDKSKLYSLIRWASYDSNDKPEFINISNTEYSVEIDIEALTGNFDTVNISAATEHLAGVMSAQDKRHLERLDTTDGEESDLDVSDDKGDVITRFKNGHIQTQNFNSRNIGNPPLFDSSKTYAVGDYVTYRNLFCKFTSEHTGEWNDNDVEYITIMEYVKEMASKGDHPVSITDSDDSDLDISDEEGNVIARFSGGHFRTKEFDSRDTTNSNYAERPANGYEFFTVNVDIAIEDSEDSNKTSTSVINECNFSIENGRIDIPICYTSNGNPTKLVIYNHGAGGEVRPGIATELTSLFSPLKNELLNRGYAILQMDGMPDLLKNREYVSLSSNCGGPQYIKCITKGYEYAISKYNLAKDGVVIIGASMGGLCSLNLYNSGLLPIKAICLDAPVIDLYHDAYFSSWDTNVPLSIAYLYNWKNCDFSNGTYTLDGITYKPLKSISQSDKIELWNLNKSKVTAFNPYINGHFLVNNLDDNYFNNTTDDNDQNYYGIHMRAPLMIWFGNGDSVNQPNIGRKFIQILRNGGSMAYFRTYPTSQHCVWNIQTCVTETLNFIDKYK